MDELRSIGLLFSRRYHVVGALAAVVAAILAATVFFIDTFTASDSAIAVLYGLALLLAAEVLPRSGTLKLAGGFVLVTLGSFLYSVGAGRTDGMELRLVVSVAAITMTAAVLARHATSKDRLVDFNIALKRSEIRYRGIFEQSRVALWEQDFTLLRDMLGRLRDNGVSDLKRHSSANPAFLPRCGELIITLSANQATLELLGEPEEEVVGPVRRFLPADDDCLLELVEAVFKGEPQFEGRVRLVRSDGAQLSVLMGLSFPDDDIGYDRIVVGMFDVTQRELTQKALLAAQAEMAKASRVATLGALSASLAHELNQPIGALVLNAQSCLRWLKRSPADIGAAVEASERMVRDSHRAAQILRSTRELVLRNSARPESSDLTSLIDETCLLLEHEITSESIVLQTKMPMQLPPVKIARAEFQQVLVNLLSNGIQAIVGGSAASKRLAIECVIESASAVRVSVRDYGPGISDEHLARVFEPFFTTKETGMGIGLSICRSIIEAQGGKLSASNHEAGGAVFEVRLPTEVTYVQ